MASLLDAIPASDLFSRPISLSALFGLDLENRARNRRAPPAGTLDESIESRWQVVFTLM